MTKSSGLGDNFYVAGNNLSNDTSALSKIAGPLAVIDVTGIDKSAHERLGGKRDGQIDWTSFWNPTGAHPVLSALPTGDTLVSYYFRQVIGNPAANMVAKQIDYNPTRGTDGSLTVAVSAMANAYGLEWGQQLTPGIRTDAAATNGASWDGGAASNFGLQAYLHVFAFTGTDVTIKLQDSADNATFADLAAAAFTQVTAGPGWQRLAISNAATVRRYLRAVTVTTGGFTSVQFAVTAVRNLIAGVVF